MDLGSKKCRPCEGGTLPFTRAQAEQYFTVVHGWQLDAEGKSISKRFRFSDFKTALAFVNQIGEVAEAEDHHPDVLLKWGSVEVRLSTHAIKGLSENDFILAYKIDALSPKK